MSGWKYLVVALVIVYFVGKAKSPKKKKISNGSGRKQAHEKIAQYDMTIAEEAQVIADKITTDGQVDKLEERRDNAEIKVEDASTERGRESAQRKVDILDRAIDLVYEKILRYQFIYEPDVFSPIVKLENTFETFPANTIEEAKELLGDASEDWRELKYGDEPEEPPPYLKGLRKFRIIYDADISDEEKEKKINQILKSDNDFYETFFIDTQEIPILDQVQIIKLSKQGVPLAQKLYEMGCRTFDDCLKADPEQFVKLKGIGPKKKEELITFQKQYAS